MSKAHKKFLHSSPQTRNLAFLKLRNNAQNCWIDRNSAVLCFKRLFHIGVWTFCTDFECDRWLETGDFWGGLKSKQGKSYKSSIWTCDLQVDVLELYQLSHLIPVLAVSPFLLISLIWNFSTLPKYNVVPTSHCRIQGVARGHVRPLFNCCACKLSQRSAFTLVKDGETQLWPWMVVSLEMQRKIFGTVSNKILWMVSAQSPSIIDRIKPGGSSLVRLLS